MTPPSSSHRSQQGFRSLGIESLLVERVIVRSTMMSRDDGFTIGRPRERVVLAFLFGEMPEIGKTGSAIF